LRDFFISETYYDRNQRVKDSEGMREYFKLKEISCYILCAVKIATDRHSFIERYVTSQAERCVAREMIFPSLAILSSATPPHSVAQSRNPAAAALKEEAGYEKLATFNSAIGRTPVTFH